MDTIWNCRDMDTIWIFKLRVGYQMKLQVKRQELDTKWNCKLRDRYLIEFKNMSWILYEMTKWAQETSGNCRIRVEYYMQL